MSANEEIGAPTRLYEITDLIRSKNAGPFTLTIDVMFKTPADYHRALRTRLFTPELVKSLFGTAIESVNIIPYPAASAIKITIPRPHPSGSFSDEDVYGGQFHSPLVLLELPSDWPTT